MWGALKAGAVDAEKKGKILPSRSVLCISISLPCMSQHQLESKDSFGLAVCLYGRGMGGGEEDNQPPLKHVPACPVSRYFHNLFFRIWTKLYACCLVFSDASTSYPQKNCYHLFFQLLTAFLSVQTVLWNYKDKKDTSDCCSTYTRTVH